MLMYLSQIGADAYIKARIANRQRFQPLLRWDAVVVGILDGGIARAGSDNISVNDGVGLHTRWHLGHNIFHRKGQQGLDTLIGRQAFDSKRGTDRLVGAFVDYLGHGWSYKTRATGGKGSLEEWLLGKKMCCHRHLIHGQQLFRKAVGRCTHSLRHFRQSL